MENMVSNIVLTSGRFQAFNGGAKINNLIVELLRSCGYSNTYIATRDGKYADWLLRMQHPVINYDDIEAMKDIGEVKLVTGWLQTPQLSFLGGKSIYYYDQELKWTLEFRNILDRLFRESRISGVACVSRYIQAWYMANYGFRPTLIRLWSDRSIFYPDSNVRVPGKIGCMIDYGNDRKHYNFLKERCDEKGLELVNISGNEEEVASEMRTCDIFVGLNQGKHPLWGEGCPITQYEALHSGCALVAFPCLGNNEYLYHGWTGMAGETIEEIWQQVWCLINSPSSKELYRKSGVEIADRLFSTDGKIGALKEFLELE